MTISNRPVTSREYKLMLNNDRFRNRSKGAKAFWSFVAYLVEHKLDGKIVKSQNSEDIRRTHYLDTPDHALHRAGFILRVRLEGKRLDTWKTTIKYRAPDRYDSASQGISAAQSHSQNQKFEEDILPPFNSKFALSSWLETDIPPDIKTLDDARLHFSGLDRLAVPGNTPIVIVNAFEASEVRRKIGQFSIGQEQQQPVVVKASLSFWYLQSSQSDGLPLVAEFSCDYDLPQPSTSGDKRLLEEFSIATVLGTNCLYKNLQRQSGYVDWAGTTKTAFAYNAM